MTEQTVNIPLLRKAVEWAEAEAAKPWELSAWEQGIYVMDASEMTRETIQGRQSKAPECETCFCIAGYVAVAVMGVSLQVDWAAHDIAKHHLGLTTDQSDALFSGLNKIEDVRRIAESIAGERL